MESGKPEKERKCDLKQGTRHEHNSRKKFAHKRGDEVKKNKKTSNKRKKPLGGIT